ncbi:MAG: formate dehydrogenase subunit gamma [Methylococcales bacterium]|jgi:formate dehydrogenase subunit gamma|nr:formate dehydrogenase subunit gamma [Methylococcales bacterium]
MAKSLKSLALFLLMLLLAITLSTANSAEVSDADSWRQIREGIVGYSAVKGQETNVLIQGSGQNWRQLRNGVIARYLGIFASITLLFFTLFYLFKGPIKLAKSRSGKMLLRWSTFERIIHWYTALIFILLTLTGLTLLYGRNLLIPLIGHDLFSTIATYTKLTHNLSGPFFLVGLLFMFFMWVKDNIPNRIDIDWFKAFGGLIGTRHPSAERMNAGEKSWFWLLTIAGVIVSCTGLILDFANFGQDRFIMQACHLLHTLSACLLIIGAIGHIYIGTLGTEGAFEGMKNGYVDSTWAKQHHDLWYDKIKEKDPD